MSERLCPLDIPLADTCSPSLRASGIRPFSVCNSCGGVKRNEPPLRGMRTFSPRRVPPPSCSGIKEKKAPQCRRHFHPHGILKGSAGYPVNGVPACTHTRGVIRRYISSGNSSFLGKCVRDEVHSELELGVIGKIIPFGRVALVRIKDRQSSVNKHSLEGDRFLGDHIALVNSSVRADFIADPGHGGI